MFVSDITKIPSIEVTAPGATRVIKQMLIGPEQGWQGWVMRQFIVDEGGNTPSHTHAWPHINYIISGQGVLVLEGRDYPVYQGSVAYVPSEKVHQFRNVGKEPFIFICIVPEEGES